MLRNKVYCVKCGSMRPYRIESHNVETTFREVSFTYEEHQAICKVCGDKIYIPAVDDTNWYSKHRAYYDKAHEEVRNHEES